MNNKLSLFLVPVLGLAAGSASAQVTFTESAYPEALHL